MGTLFIKKLSTLDTFSFSFIELNKEWGCNKRYGMDVLQRFLYINRQSLKYLDIHAEIEVVGNDPYLKLRTSQYAGCVPIMSPKDGKPCGDICVTGRFGEDISEILSLIEDTFLPEYNDYLPPLSVSFMEPPIYIECCNFIDKLIEVERSRWHKFDVNECIANAPSSGTDWMKYARRSYNPEAILKFPNKNSRLKPLHKEFNQLLSVLNICINEIRSTMTPIRSKMAYEKKIERLESKYSNFLVEFIPIEFIIHASDPVAVKEAKIIANRIIKNKKSKYCAWRIDYSKFFERYVQYLFNEVSKSSSSKVIHNPHYSIFGSRPTWGLFYIEPDLVIQKDNKHLVIDAKYKSHMFNWNSAGEDFKETFRHDLHQILAYSAFNSMNTKKAFLVYPFSDFVKHKMNISTPLERVSVDVFLLGIPLVKNKLEDTKFELNKLISQGIE